MQVEGNRFAARAFKDVNLVADPIHGYIRVTWPGDKPEAGVCTEKDLLDTVWMQRLRRIHQLQAVWWVFPGGEHTRFQHSLGAMHLGGLFAAHLYDSLAENHGLRKSRPYIEETMRLAGLLHDVGHGPFCHFFDEEYLARHGLQDDAGNVLNHEIIGQKIIRERLGRIISGIRRSPGGDFDAADGPINVDHICYLIKKDQEPDEDTPGWLRVLKGLMTGVYTVDNLDYVWRDAYMCGVSPKPIDVDRIRYYTLTTGDGLALYPPAVAALEEFLRFRFQMYFSVYYHRTVRAMELHMREIFGETITRLYKSVDPYRDLDAFLGMDDWGLLCAVQSWSESRSRREKDLGKEWASILARRTKWRCLHQRRADYNDFDELWSLPTPERLEGKMREQLGSKPADLAFKVDLPQADPRRLDPAYDLKDLSHVKVYDPATGGTDHKEARRLASRLPAKSVIFRLYRPREQDPAHDESLVSAFESVVQGGGRGGRRETTST